MPPISSVRPSSLPPSGSPSGSMARRPPGALRQRAAGPTRATAGPGQGGGTGIAPGGEAPEPKTPEQLLEEVLGKAQEAAEVAEEGLGTLHELESAKREPFFHRHMRAIAVTTLLGKQVGGVAVVLAALLGVQRAPVAWRAALSLAGAAALAVHGAQRGKLSATGAPAAFAVGAASLFASTRGAWCLVAFYLASSALTKVAAGAKREIGDEYEGGGGRGAVQVLCNSLVPTVAAAAAAWLAGGAELPVGVAAGRLTARASAALLGAVLGYYSCCCGDTWASEVGVLSPGTPRLITSLRPVRPGTNGGVTLLGLLMSVLGGTFVGGVFVVASLLAPGAQLQVVLGQAAPLVALGTACGLAGSVVDSLLGATLQFSGYDLKAKKVVGRPGEDVAPIAGVPLLDNNAVNLVSATATAALGAWACLRLFA